MTDLRIIKGDATSPQAKGKKIVAHVCNDIGKWGKGFAVDQGVTPFGLDRIAAEYM